MLLEVLVLGCGGPVAVGASARGKKECSRGLCLGGFWDYPGLL